MSPKTRGVALFRNVRVESAAKQAALAYLRVEGMPAAASHVLRVFMGKFATAALPSYGMEEPTFAAEYSTYGSPAARGPELPARGGQLAPPQTAPVALIDISDAFERLGQEKRADIVLVALDFGGQVLDIELTQCRLTIVRRTDT